MNEPQFEATQGLTRDDLAAFRMSTEVALHLGPGIGSFIRLYFGGDVSKGDVPIFTARQQVLFPANDNYAGRGSRNRDITVTASVQGYRTDSDNNGWWWSPQGGTKEPAPHCFHMLYRNDAWSTLARSLREGDLLALVWTADNNTDNIRQVGFHCDQVALRARQAKKPDNMWHLHTSVGPDNSARMIRR